jgi:methanogenic corrinoid protein MtbC1
MTEKVKKTTDKISATTLMKKTISNLTDIVSELKNDVKRIKTRMGL